MPSAPFIQPVPPGLENIHIPVYCFLISNGNRHVLFDLGVRKDWENLSPSMVSMIHQFCEIHNPANVADILDAHTSSTGITRSDIEAVIWSHSHFDHIGDIKTFPPSTELVVGPGVKAISQPGYPTNPAAVILDVDMSDRPMREIDFNQTQVRIGDLDAYDFFGDGSFYLLNAPGHCPGHICGIARVTAEADSSSSFVFMGGDLCHHPGVLRPTASLPMPSNTPRDAIRLHGELQPKGPEYPFLSVSPQMFPDYENALQTLRKVRELDALENIFVMLAHDGSIRDHVAFFPGYVNDWLVKDVKNKTLWLFSDHLASLANNVRQRA